MIAEQDHPSNHLDHTSEISVLVATPLSEANTVRLEKQMIKQLAKSELEVSDIWKSCRCLYYTAMILGCFPAPIFLSRDLYHAIALLSAIIGILIAIIFLRSLEFFFDFDGLLNMEAVFKLGYPAFCFLNLIGWIWCVIAARDLPRFAQKINALISIKKQTLSFNFKILRILCIIATVIVLICVLFNASVLTLGAFRIMKFPWKEDLLIPDAAWSRPLHLLFVFPTAGGLFGAALQSVEIIAAYLAIRTFNYGLNYGCLFEKGQAKFFRQDFQRLMDLIEYLDRKWSWYFLLNDGILVMLICVNLYTLGTSGQFGDKSVSMTLAFWLLYAVMLTFVVNVPPSLLNETCEKSSDILMRKINQRLDHIALCNHHNKKLLLEQSEDLRILHHQITNKRICVTAGYFFVINRTTMLTIGSAILTYYIMIVQFSTAPGLVQCVANNNSTVQDYVQD